MMFAPPLRRFMLWVHVITSVDFPGAVGGFLALAIIGATTADTSVMRGVYVAMSIVTWDVIVPLAFASLILGIVQSLGTPWGLFRFYWIIVKLVLTLIATLVLMLQTGTVSALAVAALTGDVSNLGQARLTMVVHGAGGLLILIVIIALSIYKPRGMTRYGSGKLPFRPEPSYSFSSAALRL